MADIKLPKLKNVTDTPKRKKKTAKRDEHGRFVKKAEDTADLTTPSF